MICFILLVDAGENRIVSGKLSVCVCGRERGGEGGRWRETERDKRFYRIPCLRFVVIVTDSVFDPRNMKR